MLSGSLRASSAARYLPEWTGRASPPWLSPLPANDKSPKAFHAMSGNPIGGVVSFWEGQRKSLQASRRRFDCPPKCRCTPSAIAVGTKKRWRRGPRGHLSAVLGGKRRA